MFIVVSSPQSFSRTVAVEMHMNGYFIESRQICLFELEIPLGLNMEKEGRERKAAQNKWGAQK